jgi:hypothetical protein
MSQTELNSFSGTIAGGSSFIGKPEVINGSISVVCFVETTVDLVLQLWQSIDGKTPYFLTDSFLASVSLYGTQTRTQFYTKAQWGYIKLVNVGVPAAPNVLLRTLLTPNNHDGTFTQPSTIAGSVSILNGLQATEKTFNTLRYISCDNNGDLIVNGSVEVSARSGTGFLSYLTDNVAVATMPAITGTVAISSQPPLSYLTDNVAVATMPAITGTVAISSQPPLSYLTDNIAVATMPAITGSVSLSAPLPTGNNVIGKVLTFENPSDVISLTNISTVGQTIKASAGSLFNITVFNDGNAISYVKLYNVAVPTDLDTPVMTFPVLHDVALNTISIHNYQFTTAIGVRATANYVANDTTAPNGTTSITAFFNGLTP